MEPSVKILVTYKERHKVLESDILTPIQTGRAIADEIFEDMIGDDTGDNISDLNSSFCEFTSIYWAWKNYNKLGNPDYIGFMHYRRHFIFNENFQSEVTDRLTEFNVLDEEYLNKCQIKDEKIKSVISQYDCIIPKPYKQPRVYEQYANGHHINDYDKTLEILHEKYPEFKKIAEEYNSSEYPFFFNMFIFKRNEFFEYCKWLFDILFEVHKNIDVSQYDEYQKRAVGFLGERLTGIYIYYLLHYKKVKIKQLLVSYVKSCMAEIRPIFAEKKAICFASSNFYTPYLLVTLFSLKRNASKSKNYDIIIFERDISHKNKLMIKKFIEQENVSIRFCNPMSYFSGLDIFTYEHITLETYFKIVMPDILSQFDKILFLDSDLLILNDVAILLDENLGGKAIGAHYCTLWYGILSKYPHIYDYTRNKLKLKDVFKYFQGGVLLFDVKKYLKKGYIKKLLELISNEKFICVDQCALNMICQKDVHYFKGNWNYETSQRAFLETIDFIPQYFKNIRVLSRKNPYIVHYSGKDKPWLYPDEEFATEWWYHARQTPVYEELMVRLIKYSVSSSVQEIDIQLLKNAIRYTHNKIKYCRYLFFSKITYGKIRKKYKEKRKKMKKILEQTKNFWRNY